MSATVDKRIVSMQFDNKQFEKGVQESAESIGRFTKTLNALESIRSFRQVNKSAADSTSAQDVLARSVETVASRFSYLGIMGVTALANITNSAINAGKQLVKSLTINPVAAGFSKYEQKTNSVKTIMNATGLSLEKVNEELESLLWFTDETSYSFTDMVSNISKFTGQGIDLKTSVTAMKGIANWAALSGQNAETASRAMYNLSQSIGLGSVQLIDWKSISLASMDTKEFKQRAIDIAKTMGTLNAAGKTKLGTQVTIENFSSTLADKWFSKDVLLKTLEQYGSFSDQVYKYAKANGLSAAQAMEQMGAGVDAFGEKAFKAAQEAKTFTDAINATKDATSSGWAITSELVFGNYEEARVLWTDFASVLNDVFVSSLRTRNALLLDWKILGGRTSLLEGVSNVWSALVDVFSTVKSAFRDIFPPTTADQLFKLTEAFKNFTKNLKMGEKFAADLKRTFRGLFALLDIGWMAIKALASGVKSFIAAILPAANSILSFTGGLGDYIVKVRDAIKASNLFNNIVNGIAKALAPVVAFFKNFGKAMSNAFAAFKNIDTSAFDAFAEKIRSRFKPIETLGNFVKGVFDGLAAILKFVLPYVAKFATLVGNAFGAISKGVSSAVGDGKGFSIIFDLINGGILAAIFSQVLKFVNVMKQSADSLKEFLGWGKIIKGLFGDVRDAIKTFQESVKVKMLLQIAIALAILAGSLFVLATIDSAKLTASLAAITVLFVELFGSLSAFETLMGSKNFSGVSKAATAMTILSVAILILAFAVKKLSGLSWDELANGLTAVMVLSATLVASAMVLEKASKKLIKGAFGLIVFATSIVILTKAVENLGALDLASLTKGLVGVGILMAALVGFMTLAKYSKLTIKTSFAILILATSMNVLASAVSKIGALSVKQIIKGIGAIGLILTELTLFMKFMPNEKKMFAKSVALTIIAASMLIFASAIKKIGDLSLMSIGKGLVAIAYSLLVITMALNAMPKKGAITASASIFIVAQAIKTLGDVLVKVSGMSLLELGKGLVAVGYSLLVIVMAVNAMSGGLAGAAAILVVSVALSILGGVLKSFGEMSWEEIAKSFIMFAGAFVVLGVAASILEPLIPAILALAGAVTLFGLGLALAGVGILAFSAGLTALAVAGTAGAAALVVIVTALISLIPMFLQQVGLGIMAFINIFVDNIANIVNAVLKVGGAIIETVGTLTPQIIDVVLNIVTTLLVRLAEKIPLMVDAGMKIILGFLQGVAENIQGVIEAGADIIVGFLLGIANKLPAIIDAAIKVVISFIDGLGDGIRNNREAFKEAAWNLITAVVGAIFPFLEDVLNLGKDIVTNIIDGIVSMGKKLWDSVVKLGSNIIDGIIEGIKNLGGDLVDAGLDALGDMVDGVKKFLGIKSPSRVGMSIGAFFDKGIIEGIFSLSKKVSSSATDVGKGAVSSMQKALTGVADILESQNGSLSPVITPVIDMTDVDSGLNDISDRLSANRTLAISGVANMATKVASGMNASKDVVQTGVQNPAQSSVNYVFNQNNYSPKALSRLDIYRQTQNQFAKLKGKVAGT